MDASICKDSLYRDSGLALNIDTKFHNRPLESHNHAVAGDNVENDSGVNNHQYNNIDTLKRAFSDAGLGRTEPSEQVVKKGKFDRISIGNRDRRRVMCPFYKMDPKRHEDRVACYKTGFDGMSRLKQHLREVHETEESKLEFKSRRYSSLGTIEAKWRQLFEDLFPGKNIPSPCK